MSKVSESRKKFLFDEARLLELRALHDSCNVLFLSQEALSVLVNMAKMVLWPTRWTGGELPEIARDIYEELNQMTCTAEILGQVIGENVAHTVNVSCGSGCGCGGGGVNTVNPDGTVVVPPVSAPTPDPDHWIDDTTVYDWDTDDGQGNVSPTQCNTAYQIWAFYSVMLSLLAVAGGQLFAIGVIVAALVFMWPAALASALGGGTAAYLALLAVSNIDTFGVIQEQLTAVRDWVNDNKDEHICTISGYLDTSVGGAVGGYQVMIIGQFQTLVAAEFWDDAEQFLIEWFQLFEPLNWIYELMFDYIDFELEPMPDGYICCPVQDSVYTHQFASDYDGEPHEDSGGLGYANYGSSAALLMNNSETAWFGMRTGSLVPSLPANHVYVEVAFRVTWQETSGSLGGYVQIDVETPQGTRTGVTNLSEIPYASTWLTLSLNEEDLHYWSTVNQKDIILTAVSTGSGAGKLRVMEMRLTTRESS